MREDGRFRMLCGGAHGDEGGKDVMGRVATLRKFIE